MARRSPSLVLRDFLPGRRWLHVARGVYDTRRTIRPHTHADFAEVFWVERGPGIHLVNGRRKSLHAGDMVLVRRRDCHGFSGAAGSELSIVNVAFAAEVLRTLRQRYFRGAAWPWTGSALPTRVRVSAATRQRLSHWADAFSPEAQSRLELEGFLIDLLRIAAGEPQRFAHAALPPWLQQGLSALNTQGRLAGGVQALAELTDKSREHINRVIRGCLGCTTTHLLNESRMIHAARQLRMTERDILDIALDCGLGNLSHFYRLFRARYGTTPRRYRVRERSLVA